MARKPSAEAQYAVVRRLIEDGMSLHEIRRQFKRSLEKGILLYEESLETPRPARGSGPMRSAVELHSGQTRFK